MLAHTLARAHLFIPSHQRTRKLTLCDARLVFMHPRADNLAKRLHRAGKTKSEYAGLDWTSRLMRMREDFSDAAVVLMKGGVLPPSLQRMFSDDRILDVVEQLGVGPGVALNPAWNLRGKMPSHEETVVPWHQDNSCECSLIHCCCFALPLLVVSSSCEVSLIPLSQLLPVWVNGTVLPPHSAVTSPLAVPRSSFVRLVHRLCPPPPPPPPSPPSHHPSQTGNRVYGTRRC
jgi:hypothetical protein